MLRCPNAFSWQFLEKLLGGMQKRDTTSCVHSQIYVSTEWISALHTQRPVCLYGFLPKPSMPVSSRLRWRRQPVSHWSSHTMLAWHKNIYMYCLDRTWSQCQARAQSPLLSLSHTDSPARSPSQTTTWYCTTYTTVIMSPRPAKYGNTLSWLKMTSLKTFCVWHNKHQHTCTLPACIYTGPLWVLVCLCHKAVSTTNQ